MSPRRQVTSDRESIRIIPVLLVFIFLFACTFVLKTIFISKSNAPKIKKTQSSSSFLFETGNNTYSAKIGTRDHNAPYFIFNNKNQSSASFTLLNSSSEKITDGSNRVVFQNAKANTDFIYSTLPQGIKEEIIVKQATSSAQYLFSLTTSNARPRPIGSDAYSRFFFDEKNNYQFHIETPFAVDAKGQRTEDITLSLRKSSANENLYELLLTVSPEWLSATDRAYPVTIDPTVVHDTATEFTAGILNRLKNTGTESTPTLESYYQEMAIDSFTVGLWHMNENTGTSISDSSGNGLTGNFGGGGAAPTWSASILGASSTGFDGGDNITVTDAGSSPLDLTNNFTLEAWVYPTSVPNGVNQIFIKNNANANYYGMYISSSQTFVCQISSITGAGLGGVLKVPLNQWSHVACVYDGASVILYINGTIDSMAAATGSTVVNDASLEFGRDPVNAGRNFTGRIDEARISRIARSFEDIRLNAQRRPHSVFTSSVIDFGIDVSSWNPFTWTELGVTTGDGETLKDSTSLVAQWNLNETSGTTATNNAGSCGASCNGSLSGFASTSSQDQAALTGWTSNNRRWGAGALMFDGTNDVVTIPAGSFDAITTATFETWFKYTGSFSADHVFFSRYKDANNRMPVFIQSSTKLIRFENIVGGSIRGINSDLLVENGKWYYVVLQCGTGGMKMFVNGIQQSQTNATTDCFSTIAATTSNSLGAHNGSNFFPGVMDTSRVYSRTLTPAEIMSNYNAGNIELQTRVGADNSPDDGSWEEWRPVTNETQIESFDSPVSTGLISFWKLDESSGTRVDSRSINNLTANGTGGVTSTTGVINSAADFESSESDFLEITDNSSLSTGDIDFTISAWVNLESSTGINQAIVTKSNFSTAQEYTLAYSETSLRFQFTLYDSSGATICNVYANNLGAPSFGTWYFLVAWHDAAGNTCNIQANNGTANSAAETGGGDDPSDTTANVRVGASRSTEQTFFDGQIDNVAFWKSILSANEKTELYNSGKPSINPDGTDLTNLSQFSGIFSTQDTVTKIESTGSEKIIIGKSQIDGSTVSLWHLDETGGSGAYLKDSTANGNHLTPTGSSVIRGISDKARSFPDANTDFLTIASVMGLGTANVTIDGWVNLDSVSESGAFVKIGGANGYGVGVGASTYDNAGNDLILIYEGVRFIDTNVTIGLGWHHFAMVINSSGFPIAYLDGVQVYSDTTGAPSAPTGSTNIGGYDPGGFPRFVDAFLDEIRISNIARSAEEIAESFRLGRDHVISKTVSSTDLSGKNSLPFYIAADRPGSYLTLTSGESKFANNFPDSGTVGYWSFGERSGSGAYIKDTSGSGNHATPTGTTFSTGIIGKARIMNADADKMVTASTSVLNTDTHTIDFWIKFHRATDATYRQVFAYRPSGTDRSPGIWNNPTNNCFHWKFDPGNTGPACAGPYGENTYFAVGPWYHVAGVKNGSTFNFYVNGQLVESVSVAATKTAGNAALEWGQTAFNAAYVILDEFRISNSAITADNIRQTYESGRRTHTITIDFAASLDSGNLIADSNDLSFTVDATAYGLNSKGEKLFKGDKIIVRENVDGVEYIAQGTVTAITSSTGATTVASWDGSSSFPSGGFTANADVFKWQREYWNIAEPLNSHLDAVTNLTLRVTDGNEGRTVWIDDLRSNSDYLTNPSGSTITSSTDRRYFQYRTILHSFDEAVSATLSAVTVDYTPNTPPNVPSLDSPADTTANLLLTPQLKTTTADPDGDYVRYKIDLCTNVAMTANCSTFDQTVSQTGWSGQNTQSNSAYTSGTQGTYTIQVPLSEGTTYYWRSYAIDPEGTNTFGDTQGTPFSFSTNTRPNIPTLDSPTSGATGVSTTAVLRTTGDDDDNDYLRYKIQICTNDAMTLNCQTFDQTSSQTGWSGQNTQSGTAYTSGAQAVYTVQTPLQLSTTYHWRSYAIDPAGINLFGSTQATPFSFTTVSAPAQPSQCLAVKADDNSQIVLTWTDNSTNEDGYQVWRVVNGGAPSQLGSNLAANTVTLTDNAVSNNNSYGYLIRSFQIIDSVTYYSNFCSTATLHLAENNFRFEGIQFN